METKTSDYFTLDSLSVLELIVKWKKQLMILSIAAILISIAVAFIIPPKFKSSAILFPATTNSISQAILTDQLSGQPKDLMEFGEEEEAEQLLQILHSDVIRNKITEKYHLMEHYDIDIDGKYPYTELYEEWEENITFSRTQFMAVEIEVLDTDPQIAANIANDISELLNQTKTFIQKERAVEALKIAESAYVSKVNLINEIRDSLKSINSKGVFDFDEQSLALNDAYAKAIISGNKAGATSIESKLAILAEHGSDFLKLSQTLEYEVESLTKQREKYERTKVDAEKTIPHIFIVNKAVPAEKKTYPVRWLIVLVSTLGTFILSLIVIIGMENLKGIKLKES